MVCSLSHTQCVLCVCVSVCVSVAVCRYDDLKSAQDNMDLQSTILSRFDLIFIVKDPATEERDAAIARKVSDECVTHICGSVTHSVRLY